MAGQVCNLQTTYGTQHLHVIRAFDVIGEVVFSKPFGFLEQGKDIGNAIQNSLALSAYISVAGYFR
jgi:hypothetical protein